MAGQVHHVAVHSASFEETVRFFEEVFEMEVSRTAGEKPARKLWFRQGIQVNEVSGGDPASGLYDHIGIQVTSKAETLEKAAAFGCNMLREKPGWFVTPEGYVIELMIESKTENILPSEEGGTFPG